MTTLHHHLMSVTALTDNPPDQDPTSGVQYAVLDPDGQHHTYGDQSWVKYGGPVQGGSHPGGRIQSRTVTVTYGPWADHHETVNPPVLAGFAEHYGVRVAIIGDDGETFVAMGRVEKRRALAAFARMSRVDLGWLMGTEISHRIRVEDLRHELWTVATVCGDCAGDPECGECAQIRAADWWLRPAIAGEAAFPVTVLVV